MQKENFNRRILTMAINPELIYPSGRPYTPYQPTEGTTPSWQRVTDIPSLTTTPSYGGGYAPQSDNELFGGISRFEAATPKAAATRSARPMSTTSPSSRYSSFMTPQFMKYGGAGRSSGRTTGTSRPQMPYGSMSFWQPGAGTTKPSYTAPTYTPPAFSQERVSELQEQLMGAPLGRLRRGLERSLTGSRYIENPAVRAMIEREALGGYGAGISDIRTGTGREAYQKYLPEFTTQVQTAQTQFQADVQSRQAQFTADLEEYLRSGRRITTPVQAGGEQLTYRQPRIV